MELAPRLCPYLQCVLSSQYSKNSLASHNFCLLPSFLPSIDPFMLHFTNILILNLLFFAVVLGVLLVVIAAYWFWALCSINGDGLFKGFLFIMWTSFPLAIGSIYLLAGKLNGATKISWWFVFAPAFAFHAFLLLTTPIFVVRFPDQAFILDRVGPSYGKSIKPRYRVNIIFLTAAILNIPVALFSALLCVHMEYNRVPWPAVFSPLFIAEIFALGRT